MIIAQISDTHILAKSADDPEGAARADNLRRCVADINRQGVDAVIHTGDSVHHAQDEEYAHLREILDELEVPFYLVPGNRDRHENLRRVFADHPLASGEGDHLCYVIDAHPLRLIGLDSVDAGERKGVFPAARLAWLEDTLAREPDRPTLLFMHHPPFDIDPHFVGGYRRQHEAHDLTALVRRHPQVVRLMCGHVHCLHQAPWAGTTASTMPSVAVDLRKEVDLEIEDGAPIYLLHEASSDGSVTSRPRIIQLAPS
jgi:Icc protein